MKHRVPLKFKSLLVAGLSIIGQCGFAQASPLILGYYTNWSTYSGSGNFQPGMIPSLVDEIVYAYAQIGKCAQVGVNYHHPMGYATEADPKFCSASKYLSGVQNWKLNSTDPMSDFGRKNVALTLNRGRALGKPVLLAIGGWSLSAAIRPAISTPISRLVLINSIVSWMKSVQVKSSGGKFSGVIIEWEPNENYWTMPARSANSRSVSRRDLANYLAFIRGLKTRLTYEASQRTIAKDIVRVSITPFIEALQDVDFVWGGRYWQTLSGVADSLNARTMDVNGPWDSEGNTGFTSPLREDTKAPLSQQYTSIASTVRYLTMIAGVPRYKLGFGTAAFGRAYHVDRLDQPGPYRLYTSGCVLNGTTEVTNRELFTGIKPDGSRSGMNYLASATRYNAVGSWYGAASWLNLPEGSLCQTTWDNAASAAQKKLFALSNGLASITLWDLSKDVRPSDKDRNGRKLDFTTTSVLYGLAK